MRYTLLGLIVLAGACAQHAQNGTVAGDVALPTIAPTAANLDAAYDGTTMDVSSRIAVLGHYVDGIEAGIGSRLTQTSTSLSLDAFSDVTDEQWDRMDAFYDNGELKRLRLIPPVNTQQQQADQGTEEFYFDGGRLVYVYYEPDGATKSDRHVESGGDAYYFGREGLIAWIRGDGTRADPSDPDFKSWSAQLSKEASRFSEAAKRP